MTAVMAPVYPAMPGSHMTQRIRAGRRMTKFAER